LARRGVYKRPMTQDADDDGPCKILIITDAWHPQVNGVVRTYEHLQRELLAAGHSVRVIGPGEFPVTLPMPFYAEIRLALFPYRRLVRRMRAADPQHIHIATEGPLGWAARRWCLRRAVPFTTSYHTHFPDYAQERFAWAGPWVSRAVFRIVEAYARRFHAPAGAMLVASEGLERDLIAAGYTPPMARLSRGVDTAVFHPGPARVFAGLPRPVALYVGRVAVEKNLEAFLAMDWPGAKVVVGDGPARAALARAHPDAHFLGRRTGQDLADHYRAADVFVFPSRTDTFGIVLIEALACGLPVAAYPVTGPADIVTEPAFGALGEDLATAARAALAAPGTREQRAATATQRYSWAAAAEQFLDSLRAAR
jgi:glycosyltransferase involved in cell wall biosynthesis